MKKLILAAAASLLLASAAYAGEVKFPAANPDAVITVPNGWTAKETDGDLDISSPDDSIYLGVESVDPKGAEQAVKESAKWLDTQGITTDNKPAKVTNGDINGMPLVTIDMDGLDKDGPISIMLAVVTINTENSIVFTYWASKGEEDKYRKDIVAMIRSIKTAE
jgi:hypothetical protein